MNPAATLMDQIRAGQAPQNIREYAAQGVIPIAAEDLVGIQVLLLKDPVPEIAEHARVSLRKVPEETWIRLVERKDPDTSLIEHLLTSPEATETIKEQILLNHSVPDTVVARMARNESGRVIDIILNNHVRMLRERAILNSLERNPTLSSDQKRRIEEFITEFIVKKHQETPSEISLLPLDDLLAQIPNLDADAQNWIKEIDAQAQERPTEEQVQQAMSALFEKEELSNTPNEIISVYQKILGMTHGEKVRVALLGGKEERNLLIRDKSKQVASLVLRNPKLTESEMDSYAQMRNIDSDLLRQMGQSRQFLKRYSVISALTKNPKTPSSISLNLLKLLRETDLRKLERDKNIPDVLRRQAKKLMEMRDTKKKN